MKRILLPCVCIAIFSCNGNDNRLTQNQTDSISHVDSQTEQSTLDQEYSGQPQNDLKVFYWNQDEKINQDIPIEMSLDSAIATMKRLPKTDGNFFGMQRPETQIVQFMHTDDQGLIIDIPNLKDGPFTEPITMEECLKAISYFYDGMTDDEIAAEFQ